MSVKKVRITDYGVMRLLYLGCQLRVLMALCRLISLYKQNLEPLHPRAGLACFQITHHLHIHNRPIHCKPVDIETHPVTHTHTLNLYAVGFRCLLLQQQFINSSVMNQTSLLSASHTLLLQCTPLSPLTHNTNRNSHIPSVHSHKIESQIKQTSVKRHCRQLSLM